MQRLRFCAIALAATVFLVARPVSAQTTLTFNGLVCTTPGQTYLTGGPIYTESGYQLSFTGDDLSTSYASWCTNVSNSPGYPTGTPAIFENYSGFLVTLTKLGGGTFGLISIDLASLFGGAGTVTFTGFVSGGGTVVANQPWDGVYPPTLRTDLFSGFNNLTSVTFAQGTSSYFQFDNVVLGNSVVTPEPATVMLFATGLVGMVGAGIRRRKA